MSRTASKFHTACARVLLCTVALGLWGGSYTHVLSQPNLDAWKFSFDQRVQLADYVLFQASMDTPPHTMPALKEDVPALDALELSLQPWGLDRALENECMQMLIGDQATRLHQLNELLGLYKPDVDAVWETTALPYSFRWIPAILTQWNHSAVSSGTRAGLWGNLKTDAEDAGLRLDGTIDERGLPKASTQAAIRTLEKFQRRFPNDPHRVLVAYFRGMAYATRWSGEVGYDRELDETLALYKVISRLMVNTELEDYSLDWLATSNRWEEPSCEGEWNRAALLSNGQISSDVITQFVPWWTGPTVSCGVLEAYGVRMPTEVAVEVPVAAPVGSEEMAQAPLPPQAQEANYVPGFTCLLHEVKAGDTLWNISKRYPGTTPDWIAEINEITNYIRIGEVLCIPTVQ